MLNSVLDWLAVHGVSLAGLGATIAFLFSVFQFVSVRKRESRERQFDKYHELIEGLVTPNDKGDVFLDRQIAIV